METKKGYVVLEVGYEYNDEVYHTGNYGSTYQAPKKVYLDKEKAEVEARKKTIKKLREETLCSYFYSIDEITKKGKTKDLENILEEIGCNIDEGEDIPEGTTDKQLEQLLDCLKLEFFKVVEVELE